MEILLCIRSHSSGLVVGGRKYQKTGEYTMPCCGIITVTVGILSTHLLQRCKCGKIYTTKREAEFNKDLFATVIPEEMEFSNSLVISQ